LDGFHNKTAIRVSRLAPGKEVHFFNTYSSVSDSDEVLSFGLNDSDAIQLQDLDENGMVVSAVGKIKFIGDPEMKDC